MFGSIFPTWRFCWTTSPTSNLFEDWLLGLHYTTLALRSPTDFANFGRTKGLETHGAPGWPGTGSVNGENHGQLGTADLATLRRGGSRFLVRRPPGRTRSLRRGGSAVGCGEWEFSGKLYQVDEGFGSSTSTPRHWDDLVWMMIWYVMVRTAGAGWYTKYNQITHAKGKLVVKHMGLATEKTTDLKPMQCPDEEMLFSAHLISCLPLCLLDDVCHYVAWLNLESHSGNTAVSCDVTARHNNWSFILSHRHWLGSFDPYNLQVGKAWSLYIPSGFRGGSKIVEGRNKKSEPQLGCCRRSLTVAPVSDYEFHFLGLRVQLWASKDEMLMLCISAFV